MLYLFCNYVLSIFQIEREVESFMGLNYSIFKNEDHLPGLGLDLGGYTSGDAFKVRQIFFELNLH